jgi:hypothetical protein
MTTGTMYVIGVQYVLQCSVVRSESLHHYVR